MSSSTSPVIRADALSKCYHLYERPVDRLRQLLWGRKRRYYREFWALREVSFAVAPGEVLGVIGRNGAGKSTLLQMVCGTLAPTAGNLVVNGRVAALLELGAGFNPEFSGRENVYLVGAILGFSGEEMAALMASIVEFSGLRDFIDQPVKTYSSGMYVRLAFSVAMSVEPDILVIDEALSVGDGEFARKSFDRSMAFKESGRTMLFCSHSMYQVEALCERVIWLDHGRLQMMGPAAEVTSAYNASLAAPVASTLPGASAAPSTPLPVAPPGAGRILSVTAKADGQSGHRVAARSGVSDLAITVEFAVDPALPPPAVALGIADASGLTLASATSHNDGATIHVDAQGRGQATVVFPRLPLLKGKYSFTLFLTCERAIHVYDCAERAVIVDVTQHGLEQGLVTLPHEWRT